MIHELKTWPEYYHEVEKGNKTFEIRMNDRNYQVGDTLILREYNPFWQSYTGKCMAVIVTYILSMHPYVPARYVCMSIKPTAEQEAAE